MSYLLDPNLRRVAKLRQVTIKTARDWRDSENRKWFRALEELAEQKRKTGRDNLTPSSDDPFAGLDELDIEAVVVEETQEMRDAERDMGVFLDEVT